MTAKLRSAPTKKKTDRRVQSTRARLAAALRALMQAKPLAQISVQEVIDRAGVSRSAFYAHYSDKLDLLLTDMDEFLERVATHLSRSHDPSERLAPVAEFFAHVAEAHQVRAALARSDRMRDFLDLAQEHFARGIQARLKELPRARGLRPVDRSALAQALAAALLAQLDWWLRKGQPLSPEEMDRNFHALAWSGIQP